MIFECYLNIWVYLFREEDHFERSRKPIPKQMNFNVHLWALKKQDVD